MGRRLKHFVPGNSLLWLLILILAGCASTPKVDWNSRIGKYTFDQAVIELGPPDKSAKLTDGTAVADWLTRRGYSSGSYPIVGSGYYYPYSPIWAPAYGTGPAPDRFLRLVFDQDGKLASWKNYYK